MMIAAALVVGFVLDMVLGDPHGMPSPVRYMGKLISAMEGPLRRVFPQTDGGARVAGAVLVVVVCAVSFGIPCVLLWLASLVHPALVLALQAFWCYQVLAARCLRDESMKVHAALVRGDLSDARMAVSRIVGRDTDALTEQGVTKAAVETVAENASDGEIAPLLFFAVGGAPLALLYKAVNTMDSMVGYRNERYRCFGTAAARLDDVANWIPSRASAAFMVVAASIVKLDAKGAVRIWRRDRHNHASPNSAQTESACAGALDVQLAGDAYYFGVLVHKQVIGDDARPVEPEDIVRANRLMYATAVIGLIVGCVIAIALSAAVGALWV